MWVFFEFIFPQGRKRKLRSRRNLVNSVNATNNATFEISVADANGPNGTLNFFLLFLNFGGFVLISHFWLKF